MKNQIIIALCLGLPLAPLLFRAVAPNLYMRVWCTHPEVAVLLIMLIDSVCVAFVLAASFLSARLLFGFRNREKRFVQREKMPKLTSRLS